ncbi:SDR family NAD(P)-dependent oxidoreductase [Alteromonas ponticola]|uniref:SDR family NAD(P)-dependent oxidoreductase n=1 Tax=Alteromonas ponticola TaxID=2720613 RepID=A0ABX1R4T0_9ALTE|nr:SDR family NAD(P)-dependent oxidoreductase [Alteromonas ponticola]NMH61445.1 SDR family NAD(P)-dependent oxidoreductase [Alteromonas ponticola]
MMQAINMVIGANGGIGRALVSALAKQEPETQLIAIARSFERQPDWPANVTTKELDTADEASIRKLMESMQQQKLRVMRVFFTVGVLHGQRLSPEKKLEDISEPALAEYFRVNAIIPALWLKHLINVINADGACITCVSARVGSIADNQLGGWYGYRASKAALNQLVKTASIEYARRVKNTVLVSYQPGTVNTDLSKPFQGNVKSENLFDPDFAAQQLLSVTKNLHTPPHCHFLDWEGKAIPW